MAWLMRRRTVLLVLGAVLVAAVPTAWAAAKLSKTDIPRVSAYCSMLAEPTASYGPCVTTGRSVTRVDAPTGVGVNVGRSASIAIGADGVPVIGYLDTQANRIKVAKCADIACSAKTTLTTIAGTGDVLFTSIALAVGADGFPVISYEDVAGQNLKVAKCTDAACKGGAATLSQVDGNSGVGDFSSIAIGADGDPVIAYHGAFNGELKVAKCANQACSGISALSSVDDPANDVGLFPSIAIGSDGNPVISYQDSDADDLKVVKCDDPACAGTESPFALVTTDVVGAGTSIAIGADGNPVIAFANVTNGTLHVVKCNDPGCSSTTISSVDTSGHQVGLHNSIVIGPDGFPIVSYYDGNDGDLRVALCNDPGCFDSNEAIVQIRDANDVGRYSSVAVGVDGNPIVAFQDSTAAALVVARVSH